MAKLSVQLKKAKALQNKREAKLNKEANDNVTVVKKVAKEDPVTLKAGVPVDHSRKRDTHLELGSRPRVGANLGCTLNMDNYESMRVDCWLSDEVQDGESIEEAFTRVIAVIEKQLEEVALQYK